MPRNMRYVGSCSCLQNLLSHHTEHVQCIQELIVKAQLEADPDFSGSMDFGDQMFDDDDIDYNNEVDPSGPLIFEFLKTCTQ